MSFEQDRPFEGEINARWEIFSETLTYVGLILRVHLGQSLRYAPNVCKVPLILIPLLNWKLASNSPSSLRTRSYLTEEFVPGYLEGVHLSSHYAIILPFHFLPRQVSFVLPSDLGLIAVRHCWWRYCRNQDCYLAIRGSDYFEATSHFHWGAVSTVHISYNRWRISRIE